jgi:retron-type reverse transcriptase
MFKCLLSEVQYEVTVPTVSDRIAQGVVKGYLEPELEKHFHPDSYGYRPGKSALQAVGKARERCWRYAWVLDLDVKAFFGASGRSLMLSAGAIPASERGMSRPTENRALDSWR